MSLKRQLKSESLKIALVDYVKNMFKNSVLFVAFSDILDFFYVFSDILDFGFIIYVLVLKKFYFILYVLEYSTELFFLFIVYTY